MASSIKVIVDTVCDIPPDVAAALDITLIPTVVNIGAKGYLDDGKELPRDEFYELLPTLSALPTTSACPLGLTREVIAQMATEADHLVLVSAPALLSGIYNNFRIAAEELVPGRYTLIDSGQITMGEGFQAIAAAEMAAQGAGVQEIVDALASVRARTRVFAVLDTLENLRKSGRVNWATAMAGRLLRIKPVIELTDGVVKSIGNIRTFKRATDNLVELAVKHTPFERLAVLHTNFFDGAVALRDELSAVFPLEETLIVNVNPSVGTHVGAHGLGLTLVMRS
jgi:DegV family protein with EDD domain